MKKVAVTNSKETLRVFHEEDAIVKNYDAALLRKLWPFVRPYQKYLWFAVISIICSAAIGLVRPLLMGRVVFHAETRAADLLMRDGMLLALFAVISQVLSFFQMYAMQLCGAKSMAALRRHIFLFFQNLGLRFFDRTPVGRLVTRATNDVDALGELFASNVLNALGDLIALVGIFVAMLMLDVWLAFVAFVTLPFVLVLVLFVRQRAKRAYREIRVKTARLNSFLHEQVGGIAVVQAFHREAAMQTEFDELNAGYRDASKSSVFYESFMDAAIEFMSTLCIASILWWMGVRHLSLHPISFSLLVTFTQYIRQFFEPISLLAQRYTILQSSMAGAERIFQLLDGKEHEQEERQQLVKPDSLHGWGSKEPYAIVWQQVDFSYKPEVPVLRQVSFEVKEGEKIALVGATGAGKTTVTSLLLRLYEHQNGHIFLFGRDIRSYSSIELRRLFSVVPQDVLLFAGTLLSNIALGEPVPNRAKVEQALANIGALKRFQNRPLGLDAVVGERGANFSAGERQLIAFARAIYRDSKIVMLDEATASIDSDTESQVQRALEATLRGRTALIVAHRLATIRSVDRILVFHKGRIVESGRHDELLALGGVYHKLYELQFSPA